MKEFIIIFRECLEAGLIVGIIYTYINFNNIKGQKRNIWLGVLGGIIASILVGCVFFFLGGTIPAAYEKLFEGISMYITAGFLFYVIFWLSKKVSSKKVIESSVQQSISKNESWGLFLLILFAILREGFEIIILLFNDIKNGELNFLGVSLGFLLAVFLIYLIFATGKKIPIRTFFASTTLLLVFIAAGLIAYGTHEVETYLYKSNYIEKESIPRVWDVLKPLDGNSPNCNDALYTYAKISDENGNEKQVCYHLFYEKGRVGEFLKGFFGYNSNPNYIEFFLWLFFLIFGIKKWADFYYIAPPKN
tara:strand:+ start:521 stop:1435 length:915 start_codon:yes stop_codon:yes gene_type:complete